MKFFIIFLLSAVAFFLLFYFYPAQIFETLVSGNGTQVTIDLSLKSVLFHEDLPDTLNPENIESVKMTFAGYMILIVCLIGLPFMIAYRFAWTKKDDAPAPDNDQPEN